MVTILTMDRSELKDLSATDADGNVLTLDDWEVIEVIDLNRCIAETRERNKKDLDHIMSLLDVEPADDAHKLFMALTKKGKRSMVTTFKLDGSELKDLSATDTDGNVLTLEDWEVSEVININRRITYLRAKEGEDFRITDVDTDLFQDFKISPAYTQVQCAQGDMTKILPLELQLEHLFQDFKISPAYTQVQCSKSDITKIPHLEFQLEPSFEIDFDVKSFEQHILASTLHLKDDFSHSSFSSKTSATSFYDFSSYLRIDQAIREASAILDQSIDQIITLDCNDDLDKTSTSFFENEFKDNKINTRASSLLLTLPSIP